MVEHILPFEPQRPKPRVHLRYYFRLGAGLYQFDGQRWRTEDAWAAPGPCQPDPVLIGDSVLIRITDCSTGEVSLPLSEEELEAEWNCRRGRGIPELA